MKRLSGWRWIFVAAAALSGCTTFTPLQTASTVAPGRWRVGAQGALSPACSVTAPFSGLSGRLNGCYVAPRGVPTPELRAYARRGLDERSDTGASLHASMVLPVGVLLGATGDYRRELWSRALEGSGRRQLLTVGPQLGVALVQFSDRSSTPTPPEWQTELVLPLYFGHQLDWLELVASPRFAERIVFSRQGVFDSGYLGLSLAAISRTKVQVAVGLDYTAPTGMLGGGLFTLSAGLAYDLAPGER